MAEEKVIIDVEVKGTGKGEASIKSLKGELRSLKNELGQLDPASKAFSEAAKRAGQLQEQIRGVNDAIENADPEKKFAPFSRTVAGLAGGFSAAQGAMALFGSESEDLQKTLVKVQGAMALSQGLNSLLEFKNDFKDLGKIIVGQVVKSFTTLRGAIIATGIGAVAIAVGTLIANWKEFSAAITKSFPGFKVVTDFFKNIRQIGVGTLQGLVEGFKVIGDVVGKLFTGDFSGAIKSAKEFGARVAVAYNEGYAEEDRKIKIENGLKDRKFQLDLEEAKGKDVKAKRVKLLKDELSILEKGSEEYNAKLIEIENIRTEIRNDALNKKKEQDELAKKLEDERLNKLKEQAAAETAIANLKVENARKAYDETKKQVDSEIQEIETLRNAALLAVKDNTLSFETRQQILEEYLKAGYITQKEYADAEIALEKEKTNQKIALIDAYSSILGSASELAGRDTATGKALAVASATISTYSAIAKTLSAFAGVPIPGYAIVQSIATGIAGLAAVKNILAVQVPGVGAGGPTPSMPSAPRIPQNFSGTSINQSNPIPTTQLNVSDNRVYVVETDITDSQNKVKGIVRKATIK